MEHQTLCRVWPGRLPSSSFQAKEKGGWPSHTRESPLLISCSTTLSQPQSKRGRMCTGALKEMQGTGNMMSSFEGITSQKRAEDSLHRCWSEWHCTNPLDISHTWGTETVLALAHAHGTRRAACSSLSCLWVPSVPKRSSARLNGDLTLPGSRESLLD